MAHEAAKSTKYPNVFREYKNIKNHVNNVISKERFIRKSKKNQRWWIINEEKWRMMKEETGQKKHESPVLIIEGKNHITVPTENASIPQ